MDSIGEPALAGRWAGDARGTIAGPTSAICSDRYCSVPAEYTFPLALHDQACPTSRCGLRRLGSDPSVELFLESIIHRLRTPLTAIDPVDP
jgi:hypothetical protein